MTTLNSQLEKNKYLKAQKDSKTENLSQENTKATLDGTNVIREGLGQLSEGLNLNEKPREIASEKPSENYAQSQGTHTGQQQDDSSEEIKKLHEQLRASKPKKEKMVQEIQHVLRIEERRLMKEAKKYMRKQTFGHLNTVVAKIRQIHQMLEELAYAAYDAIKNMWLKMVHNISC